MLIDGVNIICRGFVPLKGECENYIAYVRRHVTEPVSKIIVTLCDDGLVDVEYVAHGQKFERIRRITGYLVGTTDRWNDAKQAEERDRVKHDTRLMP